VCCVDLLSAALLVAVDDLAKKVEIIDVLL
jgi:hypothetical protein